MKKTIFFLTLLILLSSCEREEQFSEIPAIQYQSIVKENDGTGVDNKAKLTFTFQDGDGDIGLDNTSHDMHPPYDSTSIYYYNFYLDYFEKIDGEFVKIDLPTEQNARIPRLSDVTPESIEGTIDIDLLINNPLSTNDTIKFDFYIYDRALNKSNVESTPPIIVNKY